MDSLLGRHQKQATLLRRREGYFSLIAQNSYKKGLGLGLRVDPKYIPLDLEYQYTNYSLWRLLPLEQVFSLIALIYIYKPETQFKAVKQG
jgi:hypothetical protein